MLLAEKQSETLVILGTFAVVAVLNLFVLFFLVCTGIVALYMMNTSL